MATDKIVIRVEQEVEDCFECPYCVQDLTTFITAGITAGECSRGEFKILNVFHGVHKDCPFRKGGQK